MCGGDIHVWRGHSHVGVTHVWRGHSRVGVTHVWRGHSCVGGSSRVGQAAKVKFFTPWYLNLQRCETGNLIGLFARDFRFVIQRKSPNGCFQVTARRCTSTLGTTAHRSRTVLKSCPSSAHSLRSATQVRFSLFLGSPSERMKKEWLSVCVN